MTQGLPKLHLAGNCAVDVMVPQWGDKVPTDDQQQLGNIQILSSAPENLLAGNAGWPAFLLGSMGHVVQLNAQVGNDPFGKFLRERLASAGVELVSPAANSSAVSILPAARGGVRAGMISSGESIDWHGYRITVLRADRQRVKLLSVRKS